MGSLAKTNQLLPTRLSTASLLMVDNSILTGRWRKVSDKETITTIQCMSKEEIVVLLHAVFQPPVLSPATALK